MLTIHKESAKPLMRELLVLLREATGEIDYTTYKRLAKLVFVKYARVEHYEETNKFKNLVHKATSEKQLTDHTRKLHPLTIEVLKHWNSKDSLPTHKVAIGVRFPLCKSKQTKIVQTLDTVIRKLNKGLFYKQFREDIKEERFLNLALKDNITALKIAIDNVAYYYSAEYDGYGKKPLTINQFFVNLTHQIYDADSKIKFKYKYPFLYWLENKPLRKQDNQYAKKSTYPALTSSIVDMFTRQGLRLTPTHTNVITDNANKIYTIVKNNLPENKHIDNVLVNIPTLLFECIKRHNKDVHPNSLYSIINYNFEDYLRKMRYIL